MGKKIDYLPAAVEDQLKLNLFTKHFQDGKINKWNKKY